MPRITITLSDQQHDLFRALSKYTGRPMSGWISELLEASTPVLERTAAIFQRLYEQQQLQNTKIQNEMQQAQDALEPLAAQALNQFDLFLAGLDTENRAEKGRGVHDEDERSEGSTPHTNRGDTPPQVKPLETPSRKASSGVKTTKKNKTPAELKS